MDVDNAAVICPGHGLLSVLTGRATFTSGTKRNSDALAVCFAGLQPGSKLHVLEALQQLKQRGLEIRPCLQVVLFRKTTLNNYASSATITT